MRIFVLAFCVIFAAGGATAKTPTWPDPYWNIPGDFCATKYPKMQCCEGRDDPCNVPILGTLCYCDTFCNRTENSDCCPDYWTHCAGLEADDLQYAVGRPEEVVKPPPGTCPKGATLINDPSNPSCELNGRTYGVREVFMDNCNACRCQPVPGHAHCMEPMCEKNFCLVDENLIAQLEATPGLGWRPARNYSQFWSRTLDEGLRKRLGTTEPRRPVSSRVSITNRRPTDCTLKSMMETERRFNWLLQ